MFEIEKVYLFDCHDFMKFVKQHYNRDIDILAVHAEISGNDSFVEIDVTKEAPDDGWWPEEEDLANNPSDAIEKWLADDEDFKFLERELGINETIILWDLCRKDLIPEGKYVMKAWW